MVTATDEPSSSPPHESARFVFAPLRDGELLIREEPPHDTAISARFANRTCVVPVVAGTASTTSSTNANAAVFGRCELLNALRTAHSGRDDLKCACPACEAVCAWVRYKVSRDLFRAVTDDDGAVRLWVQRKKYDLVHEGLVQIVRRCPRDEGEGGGDKQLASSTVAVAMHRDTTTDEEGRVWIGPTVLRPGDVLHVHHETHEPTLEFRLCRVVEQQGADLEPKQQPAKNNNGESPPPLPVGASSPRIMSEEDDNDPTVDLSAAVLKKRHGVGSGVALPNFGMQDDGDMEMNDGGSSILEEDENAQLLFESQQRSPAKDPPSLASEADHQDRPKNRAVPGLQLQAALPTNAKPAPEAVRAGSKNDVAAAPASTSKPAAAFKSAPAPQVKSQIGASTSVVVVPTNKHPPTTSEVAALPELKARLEPSASAAETTGQPQRTTPVAPLQSTVVDSRGGSAGGVKGSARPAPAAASSKKNTEEPFVIYFVPVGSDMKQTDIDCECPAGYKQFAIERGAVVLDSFNKNCPPWPTHLVIGQKIGKEDLVVSHLGFKDREEMGFFLDEHGIVCAKTIWVKKGNRFQKPSMSRPKMTELRHGFMNTKRRHPNIEDGAPPIARPRTEDHSAAAAPALRNKELSELFRKISKLYQECSVDTQETWKSYSYQKAAGRIRYLDFEVTDDPEVMHRFKNVKGFGSSMVEDVKDYFERGTGTCSRLLALETDDKRVARRAMMKIWGVGKKTATELESAGYRRIGDVRQALKIGRLRLERNQYIGVEYYEDFQEKMSRPQVEAIGAIVKAAVHERFPSAEIEIMGSYRRGKEACGDVDIMIFHPDYVDKVPSKGLGKIVDSLRETGHIEHHLTQIDGMDHNIFETLPPRITSQLRPRTKDKPEKLKVSSYMGVFCVEGKRRHVDIKFYPYSERVYATLYFTGNGFFNRSMRLWAKQKFGFKLSDHGLTDNGRLVLKNPKTEKDVFDRLDLHWKEPTERNNFDDVQSKRPGETMAVFESVKQGDLVKEDAEDHAWIS